MVIPIAFYPLNLFYLVTLLSYFTKKGFVITDSYEESFVCDRTIICVNQDMVCVTSRLCVKTDQLH